MYKDFPQNCVVIPLAIAPSRSPACLNCWGFVSCGGWCPAYAICAGGGWKRQSIKPGENIKKQKKGLGYLEALYHWKKILRGPSPP